MTWRLKPKRKVIIPEINTEFISVFTNVPVGANALIPATLFSVGVELFELELLSVEDDVPPEGPSVGEGSTVGSGLGVGVTLGSIDSLLSNSGVISGVGSGLGVALGVFVGVGVALGVFVGVGVAVGAVVGVGEAGTLQLLFQIACPVASQFLPLLSQDPGGIISCPPW